MAIRRRQRQSLVLSFGAEERIESEIWFVSFVAVLLPSAHLLDAPSVYFSMEPNACKQYVESIV